MRIGPIMYDGRGLAAWADAQPRNHAGRRVYDNGHRQLLTPDQIAEVERIRALAIRELGNRAGVLPFNHVPPRPPRQATPNHVGSDSDGFAGAPHSVFVLEQLRWRLDQRPSQARLLGHPLAEHDRMAEIPGMRAGDRVRVFDSTARISHPSVGGFLQAVYNATHPRGRAILGRGGRPLSRFKFRGALVHYRTAGHRNEWTFDTQVVPRRIRN